jgi:hypothetical protein
MISKSIQPSPTLSLSLWLNIDGLRKEENRVGCGGIIRGSSEKWLVGFSKYARNCRACVVEL